MAIGNGAPDSVMMFLAAWLGILHLSGFGISDFGLGFETSGISGERDLGLQFGCVISLIASLLSRCRHGKRL